MASSPPVRHCGTTRARKDWESGEWTANLKLPPLGIPPRLRGGGCQGHDAEQVSDLSTFGKGSTDKELGQYSNSDDRLIPTYDDDFVLELDSSAYRVVLYVNDVTIPSRKIADAVHRMSKQYPHDEVTGVVYVDEWI